MLNITARIEKVFKDHFHNQNKEFKEGFLTCLNLYDIGIHRLPKYNLAVKVFQLQQQIEQLERLNKQSIEQIKTYKQIITNNQKKQK